MKFTISSYSQRASLVGALLSIACVLPVAAQREQKREKVSPEQEQLYVVSAKAGGVNHATGAVHVTRGATGQRQIIARGDELSDSDRVSVGETGKIEILLNPGSFLRLAENTDLELTDTSLESLKLKLTAGSALFEATAIGGDDGADISINTPQAKIELQRSGIYRINVDINATEIYVWKGEARVGNEIVKSNRKTVVGKNGVMAGIVKFDKDEARDALDLWSKDRAKDLAKANNRLKNRELARALRSSSLFGFGARPFGAGYWVLNRLTGGYCFVPYGFGYWGSPYGYGYGNGVFYDRRPIVIVRQPTYDPEARRPGSKMPSAITLPPPSTVRSGKPKGF